VSVAIGLDVGTSGVKALAVAEDGEIVGRAEVEYGLSTPKPGWAEQDPEDWWRGTQQALEELRAEDVSGIGLSGQMHGLVALDADESVLRPAILWNDQRTGEQCAEIEERVGLSDLVAATGNRALTGFTAPKLLWLREHAPDVYSGSAQKTTPEVPGTTDSGAPASTTPTPSAPAASGETSDGIPVASCSCPTWPASARRTPTRTPAGRSRGCRCATTAGRSCARCWKASPSGCATPWI
jgi:hypothetical protein